MSLVLTNSFPKRSLDYCYKISLKTAPKAQRDDCVCLASVRPGVRIPEFMKKLCKCGLKSQHSEDRDRGIPEQAG